MPPFMRADRLRNRRVLHAAALLAVVGSVTMPTAVSAQHEHPRPARPDSSRTDSATRRAPTDSMAAMPGMNQGGHDMQGMQSMQSMQNMMEGPLGISHERLGSGTSWMPDSSPMHANHKMWGDWTVMLHGVAFGQFDDQGSQRGDRQFGIVDWEMLMAMRKIGTGQLHLHTMVSLEPATLGPRGYPLLLQTGESYKGQPLHDRQHPHDAFMEVAAMFDQPIARNLAFEVYGGPAGEPALGPVAFMHRPSAQSDPLAPLGHHWQDATHISFGVVTAGLYSRRAKLEGSWFNGREPDENRWDFDLRRFDSWSGRLTVNPTGRVSVSGWYGFLPSPEALHPDESVHRYGASLLYGGQGLRGGALATSLVWGANAIAGTVENSLLAESNLEIGAKNTVFGRAEHARKSAEDLVLSGIDPSRQFDINSFALGYVREIASIRGGTIGVGGRASINFVPGTVGAFYGTRTPKGIDVYVRVRPKKMSSHGAMSMSDHGAPGHAIPAMPGMPGMSPTSAMPAMPGMQPGAQGTRAGHEMLMHPDSTRATHDSMPGMDMRGMSKMTGRSDSIARKSADSSSKRMSDDMSNMPGMKPTTAKADSSAHARAHHARSATRSRQTQRATTRAKSDHRKAAPKRAARPHATPSMPSMPGMKMPMDTTKPRKP